MDARLQVEKGPTKVRRIYLRRPEILVGRLKGCHLRIPGAAISRKHCRLFFQDGLLNVEDLESSNGTWVNDIRITEIQPLNPGDRLKIGPLVFQVQYQPGSVPEKSEELDELDLVEEVVLKGEETPNPEPVQEEPQEKQISGLEEPDPELQRLGDEIFESLSQDASNQEMEQSPAPTQCKHTAADPETDEIPKRENVSPTVAADLASLDIREILSDLEESTEETKERG